MERDFREMWLELGGMNVLERRGRPAMMLHPSRRGELLVQGVADQDVREPQTLRVRRDLSDDALRHRFVQGVVQLLLRKRAEALNNVDPELSTEHRGE
jgi:hypothetical protein